MYLTRSGLSRPGVFLLVTNLLVTIMKARPHDSFSTSPIKSFQHWSRLFSMPSLRDFFFSLLCQLPLPNLLRGWFLVAWEWEGDEFLFPFFAIRSSGGKGASLFFHLDCVLGVSLRDADLGLRKISILLEVVWDSSLFWISTPFCNKHLWVLRRLSKTTAASPTLVLTVIGVLWRIPSCITLRPSPASPFFHFALSGAGGYLSIPHVPKESHSLSSPYFFVLYP